MARLVPIGVAGQELGVHPMTLRRWETEGRIDPPVRTQGGRRRYGLAKLRAIAPHKAPSTRATIVYARVSTNGQKDDLVRQVALLESYRATNGWVYEIISDLGSGLNYHKRGLKTLVSRICSGDVGRLVLSHKDRLLRFGSVDATRKEPASLPENTCHCAKGRPLQLQGTNTINYLHLPWGPSKESRRLCKSLIMPPYSAKTRLWIATCEFLNDLYAMFSTNIEHCSSAP
jgi:predicted site-specific integrase-resolvase